MDDAQYQALLSPWKYSSGHLGRVLILGLGKSGKAAFRYCKNLLGTRVDAILVAGGASCEDSLAFAAENAAEGVEFFFDSYDIVGSWDLCIASPGIPQFSDFYDAAAMASRELISEVEFAWRESTPSSRWIAITGTNGKSTTTALTAHILRSAGKAACAVGNIGDTCIDAVAQGRTDIYVAEVSSYQLASTTYFAPDVAVLLNITPDHLEWHKSHEEYVKAKMKIFNCLSLIPQSCAILNASDEGVWQAVNYLNAKTPEKDGFARVILGDFSGLDKRFEGATQTAYLRDKNMCFQAADQEFDFGSIDELRIKGMHNVVNALAAGISAVLQGVSAAEVAAALKTFEPLEHRIEPCGSVGGVACYNDSKATNSDSTLKALEAFGAGKTVVLLGGYDKGTDLTALVRGVEKSCKVAVCFGAAGPRFLEAFGAASVASFGAKNLKDAFDVALKQADFGDVILLSPACASFDEFENFEHRGRAFKELVADEARKRGA